MRGFLTEFIYFKYFLVLLLIGLGNAKTCNYVFLFVYEFLAVPHACRISILFVSSETSDKLEQSAFSLHLVFSERLTLRQRSAACFYELSPFLSVHT